MELLQAERDSLLRTVAEERARTAEIQRLAEAERAIVERLKREGNEGELSATEARLRILQLKQDMQAAGAKAPRRPTTGLFKSVCSTDLLFLLDTTGSMWDYINAAKDQVRSIVKDIGESFLGEAEVRVAVVGYKDHGDKPNIQFLDFTPSVDEVHRFLNTLQATGGGDAPEDVLGGLQQAINASWSHQTRCVIHIADAPPHGSDLQLVPDAGDKFPVPGTEPHGLTHKPLLRRMIALKLNYTLLRINSSTDRMATEFCKEYDAASADCRLHKDHIYYLYPATGTRTDTSTRSGTSSKRSAKAGLVFEENELGTTFSALQHLVVKMVTTSASRTAVRVSGSRATKLVGDKKQDAKLRAINEDEDDEGDEKRLEITLPQWDTPGWLNEALSVEGFSPDVIVHNASTLNEMMAHDDNIMMGITELSIYKRSRPFAEGALREAFYARTAASTNRFVVKSFKRDGKRLAHLAEDMRCQALCKAFALEFNAFSGEEHAIDFIVTTCLKGKAGITSGSECMSLEPFLEGTYVKYNNNCGYVNEEQSDDRFNQAAQAFSHFTFERSQGRFLVSDMQGVGHLLTDPAIHSLDPGRFQLADTNLGQEGFKFFFATHACNDICRKLDLKSNGAMISSGEYKFREEWPNMHNTVCCSNKLCGKIVRKSSSKKSEKFPGYRWCELCWLQVRMFAVKRICVAPGPYHEFYTSEFFCESQGRSVIRRCPDHRGEEIPEAKNAMVVVESFWSKLKSANKRRSFFRRSR
ncbi:hypothetical protein P152DRAFT_394135 [Eremomyces bilateralis CBS 781.70]|uniref:Kinase-like protein n=1 Tax=Eremomyces bilateralis CBS 781.70 TaxID=1392243 RepID=A0A6G1G695_9PEZI|nr:uncharacterized protein P152DRAFT_394135 [Eremomyces bilateralis CBS 781.70]KAF1813615.1 hypothetical protein P152DRAFT_394135 [Eremomyces bilateralis CBS 781.70]